MAYMYSIDVQPRAETSTFGALYTLLEKMDYNYLVAQARHLHCAHYRTKQKIYGKMEVWVTSSVWSPAIGC